jgi:6-phosphogluconolactonase
MAILTITAATLTATSASEVDAQGSNQVFRVYFGTYTGAKSKGIYQGSFDVRTGQLTVTGLAAETESPSFLAWHPTHKYLYAVNESASLGPKKFGGVTAFAVETNGLLKTLNQKPTDGRSPCHLVVDASGQHVLVANYSSGDGVVIRIKPDGSLGTTSADFRHKGNGPNKQRQEGPHAHCITLDADNKYAMVTDLGIDKIMIYPYNDQTGKLGGLTYADVRPGSGPRHLAFSPDEKWAYVISEMASTMTVFRYEAIEKPLVEVQTLSTLPEAGIKNNSTAEVVVHPSGRFVYGSNRGHDSIAVFTVNADTGKLTLVQNQAAGGKTPRHFSLDPSGKWMLVAHQDSDTVAVFKVDAQTGLLSPAGAPVAVGSPVCVLFDRE